MSFLVGGYGTQRGGGGGGLPPLTSIPVGNTLYVDAVFGNNATALPERFDRPYLTIDAAKAAAVQGDLIYIHAGTYNVFTNLIKVDPATNLSMVNYYAEEGVELNIFTNAFSAQTATATGFTNTFSFTGYAKILFCSGNIVVVNNPLNSTLYLEFENVNCNNISNGVLLLSGTTYYNVRRDYTCAGRGFSMRNSGNLVSVIGGTVTTTFANTFNGNIWCSITAWAGTAYIKAKTFALSTTVVGANWQPIYLDNTQGARLHVELEYLTDTSGNINAMVNCAAAGGTTGIIVILKIKEVTLTNRRLFTTTDPNARIYLEIDRVNTCAGSISSTAGFVLLKNADIVSTGSFPINGTANLVLENSTIDTSASVGIVPITIGIGATVKLSGVTLNTDGVAVPVNVATGANFISQGSRGTIFPIGVVIGNFYVDEVRYENTQTHTVGVAVTITNGVTLLYVNPAAPLAALTITMPSSPINNEQVWISFGGTILLGTVVTALSIVGNVGQTVLDNGSITTADAGDGYILKYEASTGLWRLY